MKHFNLFLAVYLISIVHVFSKQSTIKATVISISNDTTTVFLTDKKRKVTPSVFQAATTPDGTPSIELRPTNVKEIRIDSGDYYVRAIVHVDMIYSISTNVTKVHSTDSARIDTLFFRVLVKGPLELYLYTDINSKDHFFVKGPKYGFEELIDKNISSEYLHLESSLVYLVHISNFREQLKHLMKECPSVASKINSVEYHERSLVKLFLAYTNCKKETTTYVTPVKTATTKFAVVAGVSMTKIQFNGFESESYLHLASFPVSAYPVVGLKAILPLNRTNDNFSFHSSLLWWGYDTKADYSNGMYTDYSVHFKSDYLKIVLGPTLKLNKGQFQTFASIGFIGMCLLHMVNERHVEYDSSYWTGSINGTADDVAYLHPFNIDAGFYGSAGVMSKRFEFETRYNLSRGMSTSGGVTTPVQSLEFLLSYKFVN